MSPFGWTLIFCLSFYISQAQIRSCTTPNGEQANCIPIRSCSSLYEAVTTRDEQQKRFLRESQCGYQRGQPLVCCGTYDNYRNNQNDDIISDEYEDTSGETRLNIGSNLPSRESCGYQTIDRILGGENTDLREFPWMALLQYRKQNRNLVFSCGGTLISPRFVLTAAHCVRGQILTKVGPLVNVRLGEYNTDTTTDCTSSLGFKICNDEPVNSEVETIIVHPGYSDTSNDRYNDIALVKLKRSVPSTDFIKPICLPTGTERNRVGDKLIVAGWGRTEFANSSPIKKKLSVPVAEKSQCSARFRSAGVTLGNSQLCAGGEVGKDSCTGDSGGPLMTTFKNDTAQWYIEGIVSFGAKCGSEGWPGIYTRVGQYLDWIRSNTL